MSDLRRVEMDPVRGPLGVPPIIAGNAFFASLKKDGTCMWFAYCEEKATVLIPHSTLGDVRACKSCCRRVQGNEP